MKARNHEMKSSFKELKMGAAVISKMTVRYTGRFFSGPAPAFVILPLQIPDQHLFHVLGFPIFSVFDPPV